MGEYDHYIDAVSRENRHEDTSRLWKCLDGGMFRKFDCLHNATFLIICVA